MITKINDRQTDKNNQQQTLVEYIAENNIRYYILAIISIVYIIN